MKRTTNQGRGKSAGPTRTRTPGRKAGARTEGPGERRASGRAPTRAASGARAEGPGERRASGRAPARAASGEAPTRRGTAAPTGKPSRARAEAPTRRGGAAPTGKPSRTRGAAARGTEVSQETGEKTPRPRVGGTASTRPRSAMAKPRVKAGAAKDAATPRALRDAPALRRAERAAAKRAGGASESPELLRPAAVRLQKVLAAAGVTSRRKAEELIEAGAVRVNGAVIKELGRKVDPDRDKIEVRGTRIQVEKKVYFVLNKPDGVVCSAEGNQDARGRPTVLSLFPAELPQRIYPVGRLDFHTRGVLIMTNDGDLSAALTHPRHEIPKTYHVKFQGKLTTEELNALSTGVTLEDGTVTRPAAEVSVIKETATNSWIQITLRQGLNRQIRRMGEAIGRPVLKLIRVAVGGVTADGLDDGEFRPLTPTEVYDLLAAATPRAPGGARKARSRLAPRRAAG